MKLVKMSLIAAVLVGTSAFAISNVKVAGNAKLYYSTTTNTNENGAPGGTNEGLFGARNSAGQAAFHLGLSTDLTKGISAGGSFTALSSLGLQGQLVGNTWEQAGNGTTDSYIVNTAWLAGTYGKTTAKIGRMKLDTPLVFSQNWSIVSNTFEAAVVVNQNIPNTTLVGAYVGASNGQTANAPMVGGGIAGQIQGQNGVEPSTFSQFYNGAYAIGAINNSFKPLTVQGWYYNAPQYVQDWWLQADMKMMGVILGAQYTGISYNLNAVAGKNLNQSNNGYAVKLGYDLKGIATVTGAISQIGKDSIDAGAGQNLAELGNGWNQSKLYTEAWWNYGYVTRANTTAENITITSPVNGLFDLGLHWTHASRPGYTKGGNAVSDNGKNNGNMNEFTVTGKKAFGPLDTTLAYVYVQAGDQNSNVGYSTVQARLTYNF